jgi:serine/threonine protein kinase/tetratricopeptide (TPR) repeat protein
VSAWPRRSHCSRCTPDDRRFKFKDAGFFWRRATISSPKTPGAPHVPDLKDVTAETAAAPGGPALRRRAAREAPAKLVRGARIGRYEVIEELGSGGMGVVYRARDAELDRDVALKLVTADAAHENESHGKARLLREAQALAQLAHPNVTAIFDVGRFEGGVFLAMELVDGESLETWMKAEPHDWRDVVALFRDAGRGLEAAHAAGLVHRDFKPSNVMIGTDQRVRVLDFGLARAASATPSIEITGSGALPGSLAPGVPGVPGVPAGSTPQPASDLDFDEWQRSSTGSLLEAPVTQFGAIIGTPPYMAPEQHLGAVGDARSDQFSFCVSFYQALYGERPFYGASRDQLRDAICAGKLSPIPAGAKVPGWIRQILLRGLSVSPEARWPSMGALLDALAHDPARRWRRLGAVGGVLALAAIAVFGLWRGSHAATPCRGAAAQFVGLWDAPRKAAVKKAFLASGKPFAADAYASVERGLDAYERGWVGMSTETCEATQVHRTQSAELLDLRMQCLADRKDEMRAQIEVLLAADVTTIEHAAQAVQVLPRVSQCADVAALRAAVKPPTDPLVRERVTDVRRRLATVRAMLESGLYKDALVRATALAPEAQKLGYRPLEAEVLYYLGRLQEFTGDYAAAEKTLRAAGTAAEAGRHDQYAARAWIWLVWVTGSRLGKYEQGLELAREAQAKLERYGRDDILLAELDRNLGQIYSDQGKYDQALDYARQALALHEKAEPGEVQIFSALSDVADVLTEQGKYEEAIANYQSAIAGIQQTLGPDHPMLVSTLSNLATTYRAQGKYDESLAAFDRAQVIGEKVFPADHSSLATILMNRGGVELAQRKLEPAMQHYRRALAIWEKTLGPEHPNVGTVRYYMGQVALQQGNVDEALAQFGRTLSIWEKTLGKDHPSLSAALDGLGAALLARGDARGALAPFERATRLLEAAEGPDHPDLADGLTGYGLAQLALGDGRHAALALERALKIQLASPGNPLDKARTQFGLARALVASGGDPARARTLATEARAAYAANPATRKETSEIDTWLAKH